MKRTRPLDSDSSQDAAQPRFVLLEVPVSSGYLLPHQVNVTWTVAPYRLSAHLTPKYPWSCPSWFSASNSSLLLTAPRPQPPPTIVRPPGLHPYPLVYTWSSDEVDICDKFLLGSCPLATTCKMHHTSLPFHWQLYSIESQCWVDIKPSAQLLLERMYCNVERETVTLQEGDVVFTLNLDDMEIPDTFKYSGARRLSNSNCRLQNPHFPCEWCIYWWSNTGWVEYKKGVSALLLAKMATKEVECSFMVGSQEYKVDFTTMTQTNLASGLSRDIRCRPVYRPPESLYPHLKTWVQMFPIQYPYQPNFNIDPLEDFDTWYPPVWCLALEQDCHLVDIPIGTQAFLMVQKLFYKSLPETKSDIVVIQQVQNVLHWDKYQRHKAYMQKHAGSNELLERHLFHGTTQEAAEYICRNNFDPRLAGTNGKLLGHGSYFAASASMSHQYATETAPHRLRHTFLAKVLVGKVTPGQSHYWRPPSYNSGSGFYDACVDCVANPEVFVVFDSCQCYPYYLIKYKDLDGVIEI